MQRVSSVTGAGQRGMRPGQVTLTRPAWPRLVVTVSLSHPAQSRPNLPLDTAHSGSSVSTREQAVKVTGPCQTRHCQGVTSSAHTRLYRPGSQWLDPFSLRSVSDCSLFPQITRVRGGSGP